MMETSTNFELKTAPALKAAAEIAKTASTRQLKVIELIERCQVVRTTLKELRIQIVKLTESKLESKKLLTDYTARNKINLSNSESLQQAKKQLESYKCELKSEYLAVQKSLKEKRTKYDKILSDYKSEWMKTLEQYDSNPLVQELFQLRKENTNLESEISRFEKVLPDLNKEFSILEITVENDFRERVLKFSQKMIDYGKFIEEEKRKREEAKITEEKRKLLRETNQISIFGDKTETETNNRENTVPAAMLTDSILDLEDPVVPPEQLEKENEDDFAVLVMLDAFLTSDSDAGRNEKPNRTDRLASETRDVVPEKKAKKNGAEEVGIREPSTERCLDLSGNESQYFNSIKQQQPKQQQTKQNKSVTVAATETNPDEETADKRSLPEGKPKKKVQDVSRKDERPQNRLDMNASKQDDEENESNTSYEHQYGYVGSQKSVARDQSQHGLTSEPEDKFDFHCRGVSPDGSRNGSVPFFGRNPNESLDSPASNLRSDDDRDAFKGFFMMGQRQDSPTPSIFNMRRGNPRGHLKVSSPSVELLPTEPYHPDTKNFSKKPGLARPGTQAVKINSKV